MGNSSSGSSSEQSSYYSQAKQAYEEVVNSIIRPPRCSYEIHHLGPAAFSFVGHRFERKDFPLLNKRGLALQCSHWVPSPQTKAGPLPCIIYLHGNSSARIEALPILSLVLSLGATLLAFDMSGSGLSEGEYVSLGFYEKDDLETVVQYLRAASTGTSTIALWGRSMGAATAIMYSERDPSIAGMVLDSPFCDLVTLAEEIVERGREQGAFAPSMLVSLAIRWIRSSVQSRAAFDIRDLSVLKSCDKCFVPVLFVAAEGDKFILPSHSQRLHDACASDGKNIVMVEGDHNSQRPPFLFDSANIFLQTYLQIRPEAMLPAGMEYIQRAPWNHPHAPSEGFGFSSLFNIFSSSRPQTPTASPSPAPAPAPAPAKLGKDHGKVAGLPAAGCVDSPPTASSSKTSQPQLQLDPHWAGGDHDHDDVGESEGVTWRNAGAQSKSSSSSSSSSSNGVEAKGAFKDIGTGMNRQQQANVDDSVFRIFGFGRKSQTAAAAPAAVSKPASKSVPPAVAVAVPVPALVTKGNSIANPGKDKGKDNPSPSLPAPAPTPAPAPAPLYRKGKGPTGNGGSGSGVEDVWSCSACTLFNGCENLRCVACDSPRP